MTLSRSDLFYRFKDALEQSGFEIQLSNSAQDRPLLVEASRGELEFSLRVFLWNITHGGASRAADEFRVQTTRPDGVPSLAGDEETTTLLLGYYEDADVFAAWDVRLHASAGKSSSLQVSLGTLQEADETGFTSRERPIADDKQEVVMAFAPTQVSDYLELLPSYLEAVPTSDDVEKVGAPIAAGQEPEEADLPAEQHRRKAIRKVTVTVRDARFRKKVIDAYEAKCAFCGLGLGLLDAAHIKAVQDGGPDQVKNGLAACPTHHRAFDRGLLLVEDNGSLAVNAARAEQLGADEEDIEVLGSGVQAGLTAPTSSAMAPSEEFLSFHREKWHLEDD